MKMNQDNAIEVLTKMRECEDIDFCDCDCFRCCWSSRSIDRTNALNMAISALEGKDIDVPANSALDHIHNVVAEREYQRGYEQGKADANHPENLDSWIPVSEKLPKSNPEDLEYPTVIICLKDGTVELGCFYESTKEWGTGEDFDRLVNPVAWMPLPEPWEGEQHETD